MGSGRSGAVLAATAQLLLPVECAGCACPDAALCARCRTGLAAPARRLPLDVGPAGTPQVPVWTCLDYGEPVSGVLSAWKERGRHDVAVALAAPLATAVRAALEAGPPPAPAVLLVPVPSTRRSRRRRGADGPRTLAGLAAVRVRADPPPARAVRVSALAALRHARAVADQAGLAAGERHANLSGALAVRRSRRRAVEGAAVLVIDDIVTTGSTLAEACRALAAAGAHVLAAATVAATPRRGPPRVGVGAGWG